MIVMKKLILFFSLFATSVLYAQPQNIYIDPSKTIGTSVSKIFDAVSFIPLETTKQSTFGTINSLVVSENLFIILDKETNGIFFFDKSGKFISKYKIKRYRIRDIQLDRAKNALLIYSFNKNYNVPSTRVQQFLSKGTKKNISKFVKATYYYLDDVVAKRTEDIKDFLYAFTSPVVFNDNKFATSFIKAKKDSKDTLDYQLKLIDQNKVAQTYFPYNKKTESVYYFYGAAQCEIMPTQIDSTLFVTRPFQYSIYTLTPHTLKENYKLILPIANAIPASFFEKKFTRKGEMDDFRMLNRNLAANINNIYSFSDLLFFTINLFNGNNRYVMDKSKNLIYDYNKMSADSTSYFLNVSNTIKSFDRHSLYTTLSAKSILNNSRAIKFISESNNELLKNFVSKNKATDNPIIIQLKTKTTL